MFENTTYNPGINLIRDRRALKAMARRDLFKYPVDDGQIYVNEEHRKRSFSYKGENYRIDYLDGCFYPFVFKTI